MHTSSRILTSIFVATAATAALGTDAAAQSVWTHQDGKASLELELLRPSFTEELDFSFPTSAGFVTARVPLNDAWGVVADLPFSRAEWDDLAGSESSSLVGNPYLGVEWVRSDRFTAEMGVRVPVGELENLKDLAPMLVGMAGELERMEAFVPQTLGIYAAANYRAPLGEDFSLRLRGAPAFLGGDGGSDDLFLGYAGQVWYGKERLNVGAGLTGRANLTTDDDEVDRTAHQVVLAGDYGFGAVRPGIQVRLPLDEDTRDVAGSTVGISLGYTFR